MGKGFYAGDCTSPEFAEKLKKSRGVILICGSCEQHGHHLPLDTDNIIGMEIAGRIASNTGMLLMPAVNYGQVWSAKGFPGTISLSAGILKGLLREIIISLEEQGAANIVLMSGHNGNYPFLKELARELFDEFGWENIWHFPLAFSKEVLARAKAVPCNTAPHAGELETAIMLYLRPELVKLSEATKEYPVPPEDYPYRPVHWNRFVRTGSFGDSSMASADYGEALVKDAVGTITDLIERFL